MASRVVRCRLPCELRREGQTYRALAVNVSSTGLFVQTGASFEVGTEVELRILRKGDTPELRTHARVARVKKVHPSAQSVVARGIGLEVLEPDPAWGELTRIMECDRAEEAAPPASGDPAFGLPCFRVVLRRKDAVRIRTRLVNVACPSAEEARAGVEADIEEGWEILKVEQQSAGTRPPLPSQSFRVVAHREGGYRRWTTRFEADSAETARQVAALDLGPTFVIETVEPAGAETAAAGDAKSSGAEEPDRLFQVRARLEDGSRIRTRVAKVRAASPEQAKQRVSEMLGEAWQTDRVKPL